MTSSIVLPEEQEKRRDEANTDTLLLPQQLLGQIFHELNVKNELRFFDNCHAAYAHLMSIREKPFLIICDILLPNTSGVELKQRIDSTDRLRRLSIPFVFLTVSRAQQLIDAAYRVTNLQGYFNKGSTMEETKRKVKLIVDYWKEALHPAH